MYGKKMMSGATASAVRHGFLRFSIDVAEYGAVPVAIGAKQLVPDLKSTPASS
jgi:hypothetical protein